jgi:hypothetical protein
MQSVVESVLWWVACIGAKYGSVEQCAFCESCGLKECGVKLWVRGTVPGGEFVTPASAFRVELQKMWQPGTVRQPVDRIGVWLQHWGTTGMQYWVQCLQNVCDLDINWEL